MDPIKKSINVSTIKTVINFGTQFQETLYYDFLFTPKSVEYKEDGTAIVTFAVSSKGSSADGAYEIIVTTEKDDTDETVYEKAGKILDSQFA